MDTADSMVKETMAMEEESSSTTVYEVDNADVDVGTLPAPPQNNQATLRSSAPSNILCRKAIHYGIYLINSSINLGIGQKFGT